MKRFKSNFYNALIPVPEENEYLLFNTLSGGLEVISWDAGKFMERLEHQGNIMIQPEDDAEIQDLIENNYIIEADVDPRDQYFEFLEKRRRSLFEHRESASISITITTTITCNMGCAYCYESEKPNKSLRDISNIDSILFYLEDMVRKAPVRKWNVLSITWYGGEPLINTKAIETLTPRLLEFCKKNGMDYTSSIVTNGVLLSEQTWRLLSENFVRQVQVTIDGAKSTHDIYRPLKNAKAKNYERILENLTHIPSEVRVTIRVNTDKDVAKTFEQLLNDLEEYGVWPQKHKQVRIYPALLEVFEQANEQDTSKRYTVDEYFPVYQGLRKLIMQHYDAYAEVHELPHGKLSWSMPSFQEECGTWVSPYSAVIDPEGNIQKCWNTIHDDKFNIAHASQGWKMEDFTQHMAFDRANFHPICSTCKFLPVCTSLSCNYEAIKAVKPACTQWKSHLVPVMKEQYLFMKSNPSKMKLPGQGKEIKDLSC